MIPISWTPAMDAELVELRKSNTFRQIAAHMGTSEGSARNRCNKLGVPHTRLRNQPTPEQWAAIATQCAIEAGLDPVLVMCGSRKGIAAQVRAKAWKTALDMCPQWSVFGVARVSGFHHTCLLSAFKRMKRAAVSAALVAPRSEPVTTPVFVPAAIAVIPKRKLKYDRRIFVPAESVPAGFRARPRQVAAA